MVLMFGCFQSSDEQLHYDPICNDLTVLAVFSRAKIPFVMILLFWLFSVVLRSHL